MKQQDERVRSLQEALPYIRRFSGNTVVIKFGGSIMEDDELQELIAGDIALLQLVGLHPVVVHGGGPAISAMLDRVGHTSSFHRGLRVTDPEAMEVTEMVLSGSINKALSHRISRQGAPAIGMSGKDGGLFTAEARKGDGRKLGLVGSISSVDPAPVRALTDAGFVPVISPVSAATDGTTYNVNADEAAVELAAALAAQKLVFLTDVAGVLEDAHDPDSLIRRLESATARTLITEGVITGGMIPKVEAALRALERGTGAAHILNGIQAHALLLELFTEGGMGTLLTP
jgi:acetylglutamate kinase